MPIFSNTNESKISQLQTYKEVMYIWRNMQPRPMPCVVQTSSLLVCHFDFCGNPKLSSFPPNVLFKHHHFLLYVLAGLLKSGLLWYMKEVLLFFAKTARFNTVMGLYKALVKNAVYIKFYVLLYIKNMLFCQICCTDVSIIIASV